jgi:protein SCO1/2
MNGEVGKSWSGEMTNDEMPNDEGIPKPEARRPAVGSSFCIRDSFVIRHSSFVIPLLQAGCWLLVGPQLARAESTLPPQLRSVGFDQKLNQQVPPDLPFLDETGAPVKLGDYFTDKPVILVLAYYRCPMLCTEVLNGLTKAMLDVPFQPGRDYRVVTVSFDPREKPGLAAAKKQTYVDRYGRPGAAEGWHFLTGEPDAIRKLTDAVGFRYVYDEKLDQYAHASGIMVLTPGGKISRYFYDINYAGRDLRLGLVEASQNKIGSPVDQVLLFCFHYDPRAGKYGAAIMNIVRLIGGLSFAGVMTLVGVLWRQDRRKKGMKDEGTGMTENPVLPHPPSLIPHPSPLPGGDGQ